MLFSKKYLTWKNKLEAFIYIFFLISNLSWSNTVYMSDI